VSAAKAAPETVTYASGGVGSSAHLAAELLSRRAGIKLVHVPFRGGPPAAQAVIAGDVSLLWDTPTPATRSYLDENRLRALAVMSNKRLPNFPEVPAIGELGIGGGLEVQAWQGVLVRSGTSPETIDALYRVISMAMALPDTKNRIEGMAVEPMATDPASFNAFFRSEVMRWTEVARGAGIQAQ
jgi:tripartite-type tricarboxylate transporter receptor subunit TctC